MLCFQKQSQPNVSECQCCCFMHFVPELYWISFNIFIPGLDWWLECEKQECPDQSGECVWQGCGWKTTFKSIGMLGSIGGWGDRGWSELDFGAVTVVWVNCSVVYCQNWTLGLWLWNKVYTIWLIVRMNWTLGLCAQLFFEVDCQTLGLCDSCSMVDCQKWTLPVVS